MCTNNCFADYIKGYPIEVKKIFQFYKVQIRVDCKDRDCDTKTFYFKDDIYKYISILYYSDKNKSMPFFYHNENILFNIIDEIIDPYKNKFVDLKPGRNITILEWINYVPKELEKPLLASMEKELNNEQNKHIV